MKQYFGAKDSEIHVIIASTEWAELLLPFSRLYADAGFSIEGIQIDVSEDGLDVQVRPILPLPIVQGRFIAPLHNVYWYADSSAFQQGIAAIEHAYQQKGIDDYVIVKFYLPDHSTPDERRAASASCRMLNVAESELSDSFLNMRGPGCPADGRNLGRERRKGQRHYRRLWRPCEMFSLNDLFNAYVEKNQTLVDQILFKIQPRDKGVLFDFSNADSSLEEYVDMGSYINEKQANGSLSAASAQT